MIDKKEPVETSNLDAAPVVKEDRTGADNALKHPPEQDSDARDDAGLHDKLQSPTKRDSDAQVHDKFQSPVEQDSDARDDVGLYDAHTDVGLQDKLQNPAEQDPDWMEGLTPEVRMRVQRLRDIQKLQKELEKKLLEDIQALENKYKDSCKLLYNERSKILNGEVDVESNTYETGEVDVESNTYETAEEATSDEKATKGIPDFWLTAMKNNELLASMITIRDEGALKYLKDIKYRTIGHPLNLKLDFFFDTNPFFRNSILTRTYKKFERRADITNAKSTGTKIKWFPKKSLTLEIQEYKQKGRSKRKTRTEECDSFFNFFGKNEAGIGCIIYNTIIPKAVSWYTGKALNDETESSSQEDSDVSSEEEEFDEGEDENESDGGASKKRTRVEEARKKADLLSNNKIVLA